MNRAVLKIKHELVRTGSVGIIGLSLLIFSAMLHYSATIPARAKTADLQQASITLRQQAQATVKQSDISPSDKTAAQLQTFYQFFPDTDKKTTALAKIYRAAAHQHLLLETGEYRYIHTTENPLGRYQITLPIKGTYLQIQHFINELLIQLPSAAVDDISFKRENSGTTTLDAQIKLTVFFRER